jgi:hypothetical protein
MTRIAFIGRTYSSSIRWWRPLPVVIPYTLASGLSRGRFAGSSPVGANLKLSCAATSRRFVFSRWSLRKLEIRKVTIFASEFFAPTRDQNGEMLRIFASLFH